jgi:short-subunit dehydrogenase
VGVIARGETRLRATVEELERMGVRGAYALADVADADGVEAAADKLEGELGPIDVWVNNAMATIFAPSWEATPKELRRATEVTYLGSVWGTMAALRRMRPRDRGVVVQVGSALAYRGIPLQAPYCGAKHALQGFLESVRTELLHEGSRVRLTMVQLPALNTPQFSWGRTRLPEHPQPVPPIYQPEVAARAIVWAAAHPRRELVVGWPTLRAVVGNAVAPGIVDRVLARVGFSAQQTGQPVEPGRPDNLFQPVEGDWAARGVFSARARERSTHLWATTHRGLLAAGALGVATAAALARRAGRS